MPFLFREAPRTAEALGDVLRGDAHRQQAVGGGRRGEDVRRQLRGPRARVRILHTSAAPQSRAPVVDEPRPCLGATPMRGPRGPTLVIDSKPAPMPMSM